MTDRLVNFDIIPRRYHSKDNAFFGLKPDTSTFQFAHQLIISHYGGLYVKLTAFIPQGFYLYFHSYFFTLLSLTFLFSYCVITSLVLRNIYNSRAVFTWLSKVIEELVWFWFYYALWLASVFTFCFYKPSKLWSQSK